VGQGVELQDKVYAVIFGPLTPVYAITLLIMIIATLYAMFKGTRINTGSDKGRIVILSWSFFLALPLVVAMQLVLPTVTGWFGLTNIGVTPMLIVVLGLFYSVAKHRLFDLRLVIVRTLSYLVSLTILLILYGFITHYFQAYLLDLVSSPFEKDVINAALIALIAASYAPIKTVFNRITNRLFYRDSYDSQVVLGKVSDVIVGNVDPHKVQKGALEALGEALRPTFMLFLLVDLNGTLRKGDLVGQQWSMHNPVGLQQALKKLGKRITSYEQLEEQGSKLKDVLRVEDIVISAPLVTKDEAIGYLILGPKKSGNIYNSQDIKLLDIATNELAVALQNAQRFQEIQTFNVTLQDRITGATRELKSTNKKLIALDEAKDEFISMASHQLRTPLTSIKGYLSMILEEDLGKVNPAQEKALKEAFGSSQRMVYLIADFLNVSRIKTGKFMIETKEVDLPEIVREELTQLREMAGSRDLTLKYDQPEVFPRVKLDDNKIRQVMMNMVDNAIYYTPTGGIITIQLYSTGDEVIFKVIDSGIGVPKAEQHKLFTKFYRAGNARKSRPDGTGLGLFMAQKIVVEQGGAIIFESEEGKGSTFGWRFPLSKIKV
jgi:signal transduction histidine kinase